jgi:hypothetical protein
MGGSKNWNFAGPASGNAPDTGPQAQKYRADLFRNKDPACRHREHRSGTSVPEPCPGGILRKCSRNQTNQIQGKSGKKDDLRIHPEFAFSPVNNNEPVITTPILPGGKKGFHLDSPVS